MKKKNSILAFAFTVILVLSLAGCGQSAQSSSAVSSKATEDLSGKSLQIYCAAGLTNPLKEIAEAFQTNTGCEMNVVYANAGQIQSQINTSKEGDAFIAASAEDLQPVSSYVSTSKDLVKHIPVLAVASGNPKSINGLSDLTKDGVTLMTGDPEATPLGKIAKKALTDRNIYDKVDIVATATTVSQMPTAIAAGQTDAAIVWKENCDVDGVETVDTTDLDNYVKTVQAASLNLTSDQDALDSFFAYLDTDAAKQVWTKYGYELAG